MGGMFFIFVGIGLTAWETMARLTRGQVLSLREKEFVEAAHTIGASNLRIMFRHILPNILGPLVVAETLAIPGYIATEAFLSFIGLGVNPPTPSWGAMISDGANLHPILSKPGNLPCSGIGHYHVCFQFPRRRIARCPGSSIKRYTIDELVPLRRVVPIIDW